MGARRVEELVVWQLAHSVREATYQITATGAAFNDRRFREQIRDAAGSVARNIAEGFGRYRHREFAQFLLISRGSLFETRDCLRDGIARRYWTPDDVKQLDELCNRTIAAITHFVQYLRNSENV
jgi:four helix bundle protein